MVLQKSITTTSKAMQLLVGWPRPSTLYVAIYSSSLIPVGHIDIPMYCVLYNKLLFFIRVVQLSISTWYICYFTSGKFEYMDRVVVCRRSDLVVDYHDPHHFRRSNSFSPAVYPQMTLILITLRYKIITSLLRKTKYFTMIVDHVTISTRSLVKL